MYRVLKGEMVKCGISVPQLAKEIGISEKTLRNKISGRTEFLFSEVLSIHKIVAPDLSMDVLFKKDS